MNEHRELSNGANEREPEVHCAYRLLGVPADFSFYEVDGSLIVVDGTGEWYERICTQEGLGEVSRSAVYLHRRSPVELRQEARQRLVFPQMPIAMNPATEQTVNFRSLLWVPSSAWAPVTATAAVPGVSVTVTATPVRVCWYMGDGPGLDEHRPCPGQAATVTCEGPGNPYDPDKPEVAQDTSCSYVYRHSGDYRLTPTVRWTLAWSVTGAPGGGQLGTTDTAGTPIPVHVVEIQGVNTGEGRP